MKPKLLFFLFVFSLMALSAGGINVFSSSDDDITSPGGVSGGDGDILSPGDGDILNPSPPDGGSDNDILNPLPSGGGGVVDCGLPDADILFPASCQRVDDSGGDGGDGGGGVGEVLNSPPVINSFSVPATAVRNSDITVSVTASDVDGGVNRIEILKDNVVIASDSCGNVFSCTKSFILRVPDAFSAAYAFVARVFDNLGASSSASGSGTTNGFSVTPPVTHVARESAFDSVKVSIPSDELFISSLVPDTSCLAPGAETFLYVSLKNGGKKSLSDVKITAVVEELAVRAVSGPFMVRKGDSASRFLYFGVPEDAEPGDYYIKVSVTSGKGSVVKYRIFEVNRGC